VTASRPSQARAASVKARLGLIYGFLAMLTAASWVWAFAAFHDRPALLGISLMVFGLGLRHAVDADHIAAIDNVTRKLMQEDKRPVAVGFFFALGHSIVITVVAVGVAGAASALGRFEHLREIGGVVSTGISTFFLLAIAATNIVIFASLHRTWCRARSNGGYVDRDFDVLLSNRGFLARILRPLFWLVTKSWHMLLIGFLFGLGFDTATEIAMFGISAAQLAKGVPFATILVFPALFAAGMSLVDTTDGVMMLGAYEWAFVKPMRKLVYNMTITLMSVVVAFFIAGVEGLGLIGDVLRGSGSFWDAIGALNANFNRLGFAIIGLFAAAWALSYLIYRLGRRGVAAAQARVDLVVGG
jgi:high-affinity nickel-transport protein